MKTIFTVFLSLFLGSVFAQKSCCSATTEFASLNADANFSAKHQLPKIAMVDNPIGKWIEFEAPDEKNGRGYLIKSKIKTNNYLFVFHEWWGLNDNIVLQAEKLAEELGDVNVIALDLYDGKVATTREAAGEFMQSADETRIRNIIQGAIDFVGTEAKVATIGWCFGGGWSMQAALQLDQQAVGCVIYYGMPEKNPDLLMGLNCKVLGIFAEKDQWINRKVVGEYERAMNKAQKSYETHWYNAEHAFANPSNTIYDEESAGQANAIANDYLQQVFP